MGKGLQRASLGRRANLAGDCKCGARCARLISSPCRVGRDLRSLRGAHRQRADHRYGPRGITSILRKRPVWSQPSQRPNMNFMPTTHEIALYDTVELTTDVETA